MLLMAVGASGECKKQVTRSKAKDKASQRPMRLAAHHEGSTTSRKTRHGQLTNLRFSTGKSGRIQRLSSFKFDHRFGRSERPASLPGRKTGMDELWREAEACGQAAGTAPRTYAPDTSSGPARCQGCGLFEAPTRETGPARFLSRAQLPTTSSPLMYAKLSGHSLSRHLWA